MTVHEAKKAYQRCLNCKWRANAVWEDGEPADESCHSMCSGYAWRNSERLPCLDRKDAAK